MQTGLITDIGKVRKINEDCCAVHGDGEFPYVIVADGMGGHEAGEIASRMAVDIIENHLSHNLESGMSYVEAGEVVRRAFVSANSIIYTYAKNHYKVMGMGTTATLAMVYRDNIITAHVGDSRAYKISENEIKQITRDHSYVQELVMRGELSPEAAKHHPKKNFITRAMGAEDVIKVDIAIKAYNGEILLVCSDGLTNFVEDNEIFEGMKKEGTLSERLSGLTELANSRGGRDNISIVALGMED
ncbi:MAG: Stp1/IreP family PP2C-type Ser/Thr phosphatase [Clostridia bacterium]|nr:Stp1/IreP family PP2C-type Ser/Thr phosphatase [Clostridia bacterium]